MNKAWHKARIGILRLKLLFTDIINMIQKGSGLAKKQYTDSKEGSMLINLLSVGIIILVAN